MSDNLSYTSLALFQNVLETSVKQKTAVVKQSTGDKKSWDALAKVLLARITIFNKRRGDEPSKMLLTSLNEVTNGAHHNTEILNTLNNVEKQLIKRY